LQIPSSSSPRPWPQTTAAWIALAAVGLAIACWNENPTAPTNADLLRIGSSTDTVVLVGAGDIADCGSYRDGPTAALIAKMPNALVFTAGDNAYPDGTSANYTCYDATWGAFKSRTYPAPGNHDYKTVGQPAGAPGYFDYFNGVGVDSGRAGRRGRGYYAYDYGAWRVYALNSEVGASAFSAQVAWLKADLAANPRQCALAYFHRPLFTSGHHPPDPTVRPFWDAFAGRVDVVLTGHNHQYERFAPMRPDGTRDDTRGTREFVVGSGGSGLYDFVTVQPNSQVRIHQYGVLALTLRPGNYSWKFVPIAGATETDGGTTACSGDVGTTPPPPPPSSIALRLSGRQDATTQYMTLDWTGAQGSTVDVYRNGAFHINTLNDGHYTNSRNFTGAITYTYRVCETGTSVCSNDASVTFGAGAPPPSNTPPTADFVSSCTDLACGFTDRSSDPDGSLAAWSWAFGDGSTSTARNPTHTYGAGGSYTVKLTVTDNLGAASQRSANVSVTGASAIALSVSGREDATKQYMTLTWTGAGGSTVDVYRNGAFHMNTLNDGRYTNSRSFTAPITYTYKVCETGTTICSNPASVTFH
jgi:PKD repeat protein